MLKRQASTHQSRGRGECQWYYNMYNCYCQNGQNRLILVDAMCLGDIPNFRLEEVKYVSMANRINRLENHQCELQQLTWRWPRNQTTSMPLPWRIKKFKRANPHQVQVKSRPGNVRVLARNDATRDVGNKSVSTGQCSAVCHITQSISARSNGNRGGGDAGHICGRGSSCGGHGSQRGWGWTPSDTKVHSDHNIALPPV